MKRRADMRSWAPWFRELPEVIRRAREREREGKIRMLQAHLEQLARKRLERQAPPVSVMYSREETKRSWRWFS